QQVVVALHHDERVGVQVLLRHVPGVARASGLPADADPLALADGIEREADMGSDAHALGRHDRPGLARQVAVEEFAERPLADEADAGRILLRVVRQSCLRGDAADLALVFVSNWKYDL